MAAWLPRFPMKRTRGQLLDSGVPGFPRVRLLLLQWACLGLRLCPDAARRHLGLASRSHAAVAGPLLLRLEKLGYLPWPP